MCGHREVSPTDLPELLHPAKGKLGLQDYEKAFASGGEGGVDVRPDQYVANVLPLDAFDELDAFLDGFLLEAV
jgi:phenol 2-monooxygenase